ncbi:MAG: uroporphyrinogen decarboxylase family protein [Promethearchaeota archaeon]
MNKRERVFKTLELEEPDKCPIFHLGFEKTGSAYLTFAESDIAEELFVLHPAGDITEQRFWNADCWTMNPFHKKKSINIPPPPEYPDCSLGHNGSLSKRVVRKNGLYYNWYVGPYFRTKEKLLEYWDKFGRPLDLLNEEENYSATKWEKYVKDLEPYFYPIVPIFGTMWEAMFEGMGLDRIAYYMRKDPDFVHWLASEYAKPNIEVIKRLHEAGVEFVIMYDDLGQKGRTLLSLKNFRKFLLPQYRSIFQAARKRGMFIALHSCGNITEFLPDLVDAGLNCIQALEPAAGVDLAQLKEELGDRLAFMGGMDTSRVLNFGTPQDVVEEVKRCIKAAAPGGGYFAGGSHNFLDCPWENILAFRDAIEKYRNYPIRID